MPAQLRAYVSENKLRVLTAVAIAATALVVWRVGLATVVEQLGVGAVVLLVGATLVVRVVVDRPVLERILHYALLAALGFVGGLLLKPRLVDALGGGA